MGKRETNFISFVMLLTSQTQILCSLERIYRVGYKYHLLRHISQIRDANPQALFGRSNYQPSRKPFLLYGEVVFRSSFLLAFVNNTTTKQFPIPKRNAGYMRLLLQAQSTITSNNPTKTNDDLKMADCIQEEDAEEYKTVVAK